MMSSAERIRPSDMRKPCTSSMSCHGVRIVTVSGVPLTRSSSGSSTVSVSGRVVLPGPDRSIVVTLRRTVTRPMGPACQTPSQTPRVPSTPSSADPVVVVLTGGASRRMGSHKPLLEVGGRSLVSRVVDAAGDRRVLVVGPGQGVPDGVRIVLEPVPGGGPVSGLATAAEALAGDPPPLPYAVAVLAADLPFVTSAHLERLLGALESSDLAVTVGPDGRANWLCAAWRMTALRTRLGEVDDAYGLSMRELCADVATASVHDDEGVTLDVDTRADRERAGARVTGLDAARE